jgi:hypothetical protein
MDQNELKERYPLIFKKHPRTNLQPIHEVKVYIFGESIKKRELTKREVWKELKKYPKKIIDKSIDLLYESGIVNRKRRGSGFFFSEERLDGSFGETYYTEKDIEEIQDENRMKVVKILEKNSELLNKDSREYYNNLKSKFTLISYNWLVEFLWKKGFRSLVKLSFKSGAYRYAK